MPPAPRPNAREAPRVKGIALRNFTSVFAKLHGDALAARLLGDLPADLSAAMTGGVIVASAWYPLEWYRAMHASARRITHAGTGLPRQIGYESTKLDLTGIYRIFLRVLAPQTILSAAARVFNQYYSVGRMFVPEARSGFARVALAGCEGFDQNLWQDVIGGAEVGLELAGAKNLRVKIVWGGQDGDTALETVSHWT